MKLILACAALLALSAAARAGDYDAVDEKIARAGERLAMVVAPRLAGRYADDADCLARFDLDALTRDATSSAMIDDLGRQMDAVVQQSFRYYTCAAAAAGGDEAVCGGLAAYDDYARPHPRLECERYSKELVYIRALMTDQPGLPALCRADLTHPEDVEFQPKDFDVVCGIMLEGWRRPAPTCEKLIPYFVKPAQLDRCEAWLGSLSGDETGCRKLGDNDVRERCFAYAAFSRARASGNAKDCGGKGICEMFMGGGKPACGMYVRRIAGNVCRYQTKRNDRLKKERASLSAELGKIEDALKAQPGPGADLRLKHLSAMRAQLEKKR